MGRPLTGEIRARTDDWVQNGATASSREKGRPTTDRRDLARIVGAIRDDEQVVIPLSLSTAGVEFLPEATLPLSGVIGSEGISATLRPVLSPEEQQALERNAGILQEAARGVCL
jgi:hypothetical protein